MFLWVHFTLYWPLLWLGCHLLCTLAHMKIITQPNFTYFFHNCCGDSPQADSLWPRMITMKVMLVVILYKGNVNYNLLSLIFDKAKSCHNRFEYYVFYFLFLDFNSPPLDFDPNGKIYISLSTKHSNLDSFSIWSLNFFFFFW